jgi:hypothetical protein
LISRNNDVAKRLGPFDTQKVPKSKKTWKNKQICFAVLKQWNGIVSKIFGFNGKHVHVLNKLLNIYTTKLMDAFYMHEWPARPMVTLYHFWIVAT